MFTDKPIDKPIDKPLQNHWIIRVQDGDNLRNSKYPFWGVKRGKNNCIKSIVNKFKKGDILWFMTSKKYGGKLIGMAEYDCYYDRKDEPLININTYSNKEQNWKGDENWDIQIQYIDFYDTENQNIEACIQCAGIILNYDTFKDKIKSDLYLHCNNFKYYGRPKVF